VAALKKTIIIVSIFILAVGGFLGYRWFSKPKLDAWSFVPGKTALVFESNNLLRDVDSLLNKPIGKAFGSVSTVDRFRKFLTELDSVDGQKPFGHVFGNTRVLTCLSPVSATEIDALIIARTAGTQKMNYMRRVLSHFQENGYRKKSRRYNGFTIHEFFDEPDVPAFSYIWKGQYVVGSTTAFLVEDAIRTFNESSENFNERFPELTNVNPLERDAGNVYLNHKAFARFIGSFSQSSVPLAGQSSFLDVDFADDYLKLTGFTYPQKGLLSTFHTNPAGLTLTEVVPNHTAILKHYSYSDARQWRDSLKAIDASIGKQSKVFNEQLDLDIDFMFDHVGQEMARVQLELIEKGEEPDAMVMLQTSNREEVEGFLMQTTNRLSDGKPFTDRVGNYQIRRINEGAFTQALAGEITALDGDSYFTFHRSILLMSNSLAQLKRTITAISQEDTWKKSLRVNQMLDLSSREASYSLFVNLPRAWSHLLANLSPNWKKWASENEMALKSIEYLGIQFSKVEDRFYTSCMAFQPEPPSQPARMANSDRAVLGAKLITDPFVIRSHVDQSLEVLVQDSTFLLSHLSDDLQLLWNKSLQGPIIGDIIDVDFYKNGKKQYAFVAGKQLHIIDRLGRYIDGYPKTVPTENALRFFSVVDYDGSKNYRFMMTDAKGNIFLMNKEGKVLNGWKPQKTGAALQTPPRHVRFAGTDAFVVIKDQEVDLIQRRGISYPGFPVKFDEKLVQNYFAEASGTFKDSKITLLTEEGEMIVLDFSGQIVDRNQITKIGAETQFELVPDILGQTYLVVRSVPGRWEVLNPDGELLFEKNYLGGKSQILQYYRFSAEYAIMVVTNPEAGFTNIFNLEGQLKVRNAIKSNRRVAVVFSSTNRTYQFYLVHGNEVKKVGINE